MEVLTTRLTDDVDETSGDDDDLLWFSPVKAFLHVFDGEGKGADRVVIRIRCH